MDNHFNNDETRRVPLPGSESPVPEQFTPEHFDDDREPEQPQKQPRRRRSRRPYGIKHIGQIGKRQSGAEACCQIKRAAVQQCKHDAAEQQARRGTDFFTVHAEQCTA